MVAEIVLDRCTGVRAVRVRLPHGRPHIAKPHGRRPGRPGETTRRRACRGGLPQRPELTGELSRGRDIRIMCPTIRVEDGYATSKRCGRSEEHTSELQSR